QNIGSPHAQLEGGVTLGMPASTASLLAVPLLASLTSAFPMVRLHVVETETAELVDGMLKGQIDVALIHGPSPDERLFETGLLAEDLYLVGGSSSALSPDQGIDFDALANFALALPGTQRGVRSLVEKTALRAQVQINVQFEVDSLQIAKDLAA